MSGDWKPWTAWDRQEGPIDDSVWCQVMMLDGETDEYFAGGFSWDVKDEPGEIVAYRVPVLPEIDQRMIMEKIR